MFGGPRPGDVIYAGEKKVGAFLKEKVFGPGRSLGWDELTKLATGARLNAKAFAADFEGK